MTGAIVKLWVIGLMDHEGKLVQVGLAFSLGWVLWLGLEIGFGLRLGLGWVRVSIQFGVGVRVSVRVRVRGLVRVRVWSWVRVRVRGWIRVWVRIAKKVGIEKTMDKKRKLERN